MSSIGPELPPHLLAKRKREDTEEADPKADATTENVPARGRSRSSSADSASERRRVIGPAPPPAPLDERPVQPTVEEEDSSSDDDFGPSLPKPGDSHNQKRSNFEEADDNDFGPPQAEETKTRRDEWMMVPPKQDDLAARMDPTKLRARGFNTGKGAKGANQGRDGDSAAWTETPEQKRKRLEDQVLGISNRPTEGASPQVDLRRKREDEEKARKIKEHNVSGWEDIIRAVAILIPIQEKHRTKTLYAQHQTSQKKEKEDDPSARPFDYEKDMGGGMKVGRSQRRELLNRASDFGSKFAGGSYL